MVFFGSTYFWRTVLMIVNKHERVGYTDECLYNSEFTYCRFTQKSMEKIMYWLDKYGRHNLKGHLQPQIDKYRESGEWK